MFRVGRRELSDRFPDVVAEFPLAQCLLRPRRGLILVHGIVDSVGQTLSAQFRCSNPFNTLFFKNLSDTV